MSRRTWEVPEPDVARHLVPVRPADLSSATVDGADLAGTDLPELVQAQIEGSSLERARAGGGHWRRVTLVDCRLDGADLANLRAEELTLMRTSLREVRLVGAQLAGARLRAVRLAGCLARLSSWRSARLQQVVLEGCDLAEADLTGAELTDVVLRDCVLSGAQLGGMRCERVELRGCRLDGVSGVAGLRGARVAEEDAYELLPAMARELGITIGS
ncbi:pentapeptide repeat-containing protein [Georgenia yuyongxinii]|uniref:Pentapeptide repeat-containing protein n=1 Tax=Georgenia yuyongxinii TaxID=2589797 RepID=A0A5B8C552_9MICO|nr:pentapeptide repeat-containing protein [Georgenia yuyongxinii]QDC25337.1 pentapeptide repeat-containing protein [Georgenia yuyongxinii]